MGLAGNAALAAAGRRLCLSPSEREKTALAAQECRYGRAQATACSRSWRGMPPWPPPAEDFVFRRRKERRPLSPHRNAAMAARKQQLALAPGGECRPGRHRQKTFSFAAGKREDRSRRTGMRYGRAQATACSRSWRGIPPWPPPAEDFFFRRRKKRRPLSPHRNALWPRASNSLLSLLAGNSALA